MIIAIQILMIQFKFLNKQLYACLLSFRLRMSSCARFANGVLTAVNLVSMRLFNVSDYYYLFSHIRASAFLSLQLTRVLHHV